MRRGGEEGFGGGEQDLLDEGLDLAGRLAASLSRSLSLSFTSARFFSVSASKGEYLLLPLLASALLGGDGGGLGLSTCEGLYRSWPRLLEE